MTDQPKPSALKHGAFSKLSFLPGEDPAEFEGLREHLVVEYQISGPSEEALIDGIARTYWQARRKDAYVGLLIEQALRSNRQGKGDVNQQLEDVAGIATLEFLSREVDLDMRLQAKLDRQFRMLFQIKASKSIDLAPKQLPEAAAPPLKQLAPPEE